MHGRCLEPGREEMTFLSSSAAYNELTNQTGPAVQGDSISFTQRGLGSFSPQGMSSFISCGFEGKHPPCALGNPPLPTY